MTGKKFVPCKPWKPRDGRTSFGGRTNPAVIDFEKRERTFQVFAYFAQNTLDEDAGETGVKRGNREHDHQPCIAVP